MNYLNSEAIFTGTQIAYYIVCHTKLWLFSHFTNMEQNSKAVELGKILQESSFSYAKKDLMIDQKIAIDFIKKSDKLILHEIKKSRKLEKAHITQLLYYLYYLKHEKGIRDVVGIINYPSKKEIVKVELTSEREKKLEKIFHEIKRIVSLTIPPKPEKKSYCRKCSYFELCWVK